MTLKITYREHIELLELMKEWLDKNAERHPAVDGVYLYEMSVGGAKEMKEERGLVFRLLRRAGLVALLEEGAGSVVALCTAEKAAALIS